MRRAISPRAIVMWMIIVMVATGLSVRPKPLETSDLYASVAVLDDPTQLGANVGAPGSAPGRDRADAILDVPLMSAPAGAPAGAPPPINWQVLGTLDYRNGRLSDTLRVLNGKRIRVPGFIVPLDDFQDVVKEFLLVPYFGACVHTPPPPPNQIVYVRMRGGRQKVSLFEPVWVEGVLMVKQVQSIYGAVGFQLVAERISPYR